MGWKKALPLVLAGMIACGGSSEPFAVVIDPASLQLPVGDTATITSHVLNADGDMLPRAVVIWSSKNTSIATVSATGGVSARTVGTTAVVASSGGAVGSMAVRVIPTITGRWTGTILGSPIVLDIVESATGSLRGSGHIETPNQSYPTIVTGIHNHPAVRIYLAPQTPQPFLFEAVVFDATLDRPGYLAGTLTRSGFTGQPFILQR